MIKFILESIMDRRKRPWWDDKNSLLNGETSGNISLNTTYVVKASSFKIFFIILIFQMDYGIFRQGRFPSPGTYWILSIIILMTAMRVPISKASWISADITFFSSFIFFSICISSFPLLMIILYTNVSIMSILF